MVEFLNPIAELDSPDSGNIIQADKAYNLKDLHKFYCPDYDCLDTERILNVKKSKNGKYFFSHRPNCGHDIRPETLLHKLAIKWFTDRENYEVPAYKEKKLKRQTITLDKTQTVCEYSKLKKIKPDVKLTSDKDFQFAIEIYVTHDIDEAKENLINEFNLPTIRVNLSTFYKLNQVKCRSDYEFIQTSLTSLLTDIQLKDWIPSNYEFPKTKLDLIEDNQNNVFCTILAGLGIFFLIRKLIK